MTNPCKEIKIDPEKTHLFATDENGDIWHHENCWCGAGMNYLGSFSGGKEPKNNDGREKCYWCGEPTETRPLAVGTYEWCDACKK